MAQDTTNTISEANRKKFGEFIAKHRRLLGISQTEAGRRAGISRTQWTRLELGESGTRIDNVQPIANAVEADLLTAYRLAGYAPPEKDPKRLEAIRRDEKLEVLFYDVTTLSEEAQQEMETVWQYVRAEVDRRKAKERQKKSE